MTATAVINPTPNIVDFTRNICNSGTFTVSPADGDDGVVPAGTNYSWAIKSSAGGITGATPGSGSIITGTLGNSSSTTQTVIYSVTPTFGGCIGEIFLVTVNVTPAPDIDDMTTAPICSDGTFTVTPVNGTNGIVPSGTNYDWVVQSNPGNVSGATSGTGTSISGTLSHSENTAQTVTYTVTPTGGTCTGDPFTLTVTVNPIPAINNLTEDICSGGTFSVIPVDGTDGTVPAGVTYSWPVPAVTGGITGGTIGSGAASISGTLTNPTNTVQTATYTVTPSSGGCTGAPFTVTITVDPKPSVNPMNAPICSGGTFNLTPNDGTNGSIPSGTTYSWSAPNVTGIQGTTSGTDASSISGTLNNTTNTAKTVTYTVTPKSGDCVGINFSVIVTVNPTPDIDDIDETVCSDEAFTISLLNGTDGIIPSGTNYEWTVLSAPAGISGAVNGNGSSINGTLTNSTTSVQIVTYEVTPTSGAACEGIPFNLNVSVIPVIDVEISGDATVCYGLDAPIITFTNNVDFPVTATYNINGGVNFTVNIDPLGTAQIPASINSEGTFIYNLLSAAYQTGTACSTDLGGTATVLVEPITTVGISRSPSGTICSGEEVTFSSLVDNEGTGADYQWQISTDGGSNWSEISGETGTTLTSSTLNNADKVKLVVTTKDTPCPDDIESNVLVLTVNPPVIPLVSIFESENNICAGTEVTFETNLISEGGTNPTFQWQIFNNITSTWDDIASETSDTYSSNSLTNGDQIRLMMTNTTATCVVNPAYSDPIVMDVYDNVVVDVSISASDNDICEGTSVTYTATPTNGGSSPGYQWQVNGSNVGTNSTYTYTPSNGDNIQVILTSNEECTTGSTVWSNTINMTVNPPLPVSVSIAADTNPVCDDGSPVTFTATPTNGGTNPTYEWFVNGSSVGNNSATFIYNTPANGDDVYVVLTSSETNCITDNPATSNEIEITVNPPLPVSVSIALLLHRFVPAHP